MRPTRWFAIVLLLVSIVPVPSLRAQSPADTAAVLLDAARDIERQGKHEVAEVVLRLIIARYSGSSGADSAQRALRAVGRVRAQMGGVGSMTAWGGLYGAWLGLAIPAALSADDASAFGAGLLIGAPTGIMISRAASKATGLSGGQARGIAWGSIWGTFQGFGWQQLLEIGYRTATSCYRYGPGPEECYTYREESEAAPFSMAILGGLTGIGVAGLLAHQGEMSSGTVAAAQWGSIWGSWFGLATSILIGEDRGEHPGLGMTLVGGNLGLVTAAVLGRRWNLSSGRPWLVSAIGLAGMTAGFGVDLLFESNDDQSAILPPLVGSIVGLAAGVAMTRPKETVTGSAPGERGQLGLLQWEGGRLSVAEPALIPHGQPALAASGRVALRPVVRLPVLSIALP